MLYVYVVDLCMYVLGTMQRLNYGAFDGTVQALKAEEKFMVLTFCLDRLFSIILTREPKILAIEVKHVKKFKILRFNIKIFPIVFLFC